MTSYKHISVGERELIFLYSRMSYSIRRVARLLKRSASTISRELHRHTGETYHIHLLMPKGATKRIRKIVEENDY